MLDANGGWAPLPEADVSEVLLAVHLDKDLATSPRVSRVWS